MTGSARQELFANALENGLNGSCASTPWLPKLLERRSTRSRMNSAPLRRTVLRLQSEAELLMLGCHSAVYPVFTPLTLLLQWQWQMAKSSDWAQQPWNKLGLSAQNGNRTKKEGESGSNKKQNSKYKKTHNSTNHTVKTTEHMTISGFTIFKQFPKGVPINNTYRKKRKGNKTMSAMSPSKVRGVYFCPDLTLTHL